MTEAQAKARTRLTLARVAQREAEARDAAHFVWEGHDAHVDKGCIHAVPCARIYDPLEPPEPAFYAGTGIGLLYGFGGTEHAWELAGWTLQEEGSL